MTREEAIKMIQDDMRLHHDYLSGKYRKALRMAIEALQTAEINCVHCPHYHETEDETGVHSHCGSHGRLIDADALYASIAKDTYLLTDRINSRDYGMFLVGIKEKIDNAPTVQAARPHGEWIIRDESYWRKHHSGDIQVNKIVLVCSECGHRLRKPWKTRNFCPACGADMRGGK